MTRNSLSAQSHFVGIKHFFLEMVMFGKNVTSVTAQQTNW